MKSVVIGIVGGLLATSAAFAQDNYHWPAPAAYDPQAQRLSLPIGTPLLLETWTRLSTKDMRTGQRIALRVAETVSYQGQVLIPAGAPAFGEMSWSERNGHFGKRGSMGIQLLYVRDALRPRPAFGRCLAERA